MLKKIKEFFNKRKEMKKQKEYFSLVAKGGLFLKFIYNDLEQMKNRQINRDVRKRFSKELKNEGKFSYEMIKYYSSKIDAILFYIESQEIKRNIVRAKKAKEKTQ